MIAALAMGACFGLGLVAIARGMFPPKPSLSQVLSSLSRTPIPPGLVRVDEGGWTARFGRPFIPVLAGTGLPTKPVRRDLAVLGRAPDRLLAEKATGALIGLLLAPAMVVVMGLGGIHLGWQMPVWASLVLGIAGFVVPDLVVRAEAANRRAEFRHALSVYLDLVVICLAAGAGVEAALHYAGNVGSGWAFAQIRRALDSAQLARQAPWQSLGELGRQLGVPELVELAGSVALAGTEGAKVRASLAAKASGLRAHQLADAEAHAQAATERLSLPVVVLFAGFLVLIGFPAIANVFVDF